MEIRGHSLETQCTIEVDMRCIVYKDFNIEMPEKSYQSGHKADLLLEFMERMVQLD